MTQALNSIAAPRSFGTIRPVSMSRPRTGLLVMALLYCAILMWSVAFLIEEVFGSLYEVRIANPGLLLLGIVIAVLPALYMPLSGNRPSTVALGIIYVLVHVPASLVPFYLARIDPMRALPFVLMLVPCSLVLAWFCRMPTRRLATPRLEPHFFWGGILAAGGLSLAFIAMWFGLSLEIHSFYDVYAVRSEYMVRLTELPRGLRYVVPWMTNVIVPLLMAEGLFRRRYLLVGAGILNQLVLYSLTGAKSFLLSVAMVFAVHAMLALRRQSIAFKMIAATCGLIVLCVAIDYGTGSVMWSSVFVRRLIVMPGMLSAFYHDFFLDHPKLMLSQSILSWAFEYPYEASVPSIISASYLKYSEGRANANFLASAYGDFGYWGMFAYSIVLGAALWLVDCVAIDGRNKNICCIVMAMSAVSLCNSNLTTVLLTHGLGLAMVVASLMPCRSGESVRNSENMGRRLGRIV